MICPNELCKETIPDDSLYCDQCGNEIWRCLQCGKPGTDRYCDDCGVEMVFTPMEEATGTPLPQPLPQGEGSKINSSPSGGGWVGVTSPSPSATVVVQLPSDHITFFHPDGWKLEIHDGDILGRSNGRHTARLGSIPVISGNHAKVTNNGGKWFLTDLNSTNKTYVNTSRLEPNVPIEIKQNDVVTLANVNFTVVV